MDAVFALNLTATAALTGLIWTVQVAHYPLFARVGREAFTSYHHAHLKRITLVVAPLMLMEAATAVWLLLRAPEAMPVDAALVGVALVVAIWLSTAVLQVPCHHRLEQGFDARVHGRLVATNWIRTILWTARTVLLVGVLLRGV